MFLSFIIMRIYRNVNRYVKKAQKSAQKIGKSAHKRKNAKKDEIFSKKGLTKRFLHAIMPKHLERGLMTLQRNLKMLEK